MKTILQLEVQKRGRTVISVPKGAQFLQAMALEDKLVVFAIAEYCGEYENRELLVFFTGYDLPESNETEEFRYLGTAVITLNHAPMHIFERVSIADDPMFAEVQPSSSAASSGQSSPPPQPPR